VSAVGRKVEREKKKRWRRPKPRPTSSLCWETHAHAGADTTPHASLPPSHTHTHTHTRACNPGPSPRSIAFPDPTTTATCLLHPATADRATPIATLGLSSGATLTALPTTAIPHLLGGLMVKVKTLTGKEIEVDIEPSDSIARIKERVEEKEGIPPVQQRLIFAGKQMADEKAAREYGVEGGSVLHLVLALRGGGAR